MRVLRCDPLRCTHTHTYMNTHAHIHFHTHTHTHTHTHHIQMLSMVIQLDNMTQTVHLLKRPNGSRQFPARSCCDLKEQYPETESGRWAGQGGWGRGIMVRGKRREKGRNVMNE